MTDKDTGGSAFPHKGYFAREPDDPGMTLRDWFAGQVLAGICASPSWDENSWFDRAANAYHAADAMLEARK